MNVEGSDAIPRVAAGDEPVERGCSPEIHRRRRQEAVSFARASIELEGFQISDVAKIQAERFVNGEISIAEFVALGLRRSPEPDQ